jgi:hypothetical protein
LTALVVVFRSDTAQNLGAAIGATGAWHCVLHLPRDRFAELLVLASVQRILSIDLLLEDLKRGRGTVRSVGFYTKPVPYERDDGSAPTTSGSWFDALSLCLTYAVDLACRALNRRRRFAQLALSRAQAAARPGLVLPCPPIPSQTSMIGKPARNQVMHFFSDSLALRSWVRSAREAEILVFRHQVNESSACALHLCQ